MATVPLLSILYLDENLVAVDKPSGLLVHRTSLSRERACVLQRLRDQLGRRIYPVHRLDRSASGVLLFALSPNVCTDLARQFAGRCIHKRYLAVVRGYAPSQGTIDHPLNRDRHLPKKPSVTGYRTLAHVELPAAVGRYPTARYSLVEASPKTGRRHQIRRHFAHISHPLIGDTAYGDGRHNRFFRDRYGLHRLMLAAVELRFHHPVTGRPLMIGALPAPEIRRFMKAVGWCMVHKNQENPVTERFARF